jgi:dipeptidyl aminopeptidase/acylaminoacyl peptidase
MSHGGPTSAASRSYNLTIQYWTTRGIAVVDVNYRGSSGFGRVYRNALRNQWGVFDTADCIAAAKFLEHRGDVDGKRMAIRGGSAGGYTTLCALTFHGVFQAGASYYGVADAEILATDTHKFESRYLDRLMGPYPEAKDVYVTRSPIHYADQIRAAVIIFQGMEDQIVPPRQAELMVSGLAQNKLPHVYMTFPGEQHGFRQAENIIKTLESELSFYGQVLGFSPVGVNTVEIANRDRM